MSKKCCFCGAILADEDVFCGDCGKKQEVEVTKEEMERKEKELMLRIQAEAEAKVKYEAELKEKQVAEIRRQEEAKLKEEELKINKEKKKAERKNNPKHFSVWSLIIGIISYPLFLTYIIPLFTAAIGIILGVKGLKSTKKGIAVTGLILNIIVYGLYALALFS